jgi:predicted GIY-YIG superfamily endonuclease
MPEALQVGVYFLIGELSDSGLPRVYIGQSGNVGKRLVQHNQNNDKGKDFWNRALVVVSLTNSMTQTHALFLEWFAIDQAKQAGRYSMENGNAGARPHTPAPLEADCHEIHETAATLLATLGQPIFEPLTNAPAGKGDKELYYCKGPGAEGVGEYTTEGFVVLKGTRGRAKLVPSMQGTSHARMREQLITEGILALQNGVHVFTRDYLFANPSTAATAILGRSANGWIEWKTPQGQTLDDVKRKSIIRAIFENAV